MTDIDARTSYRNIVALVTGNQSGTRCDACRNCGMIHCVDVWDGCSGMRDYTIDEVQVALDARVAAAVKAALQEVRK